MSEARLKYPPSSLSFETYLHLYGGIYEHSPWVAEGAYAQISGDNLDTVAGLHAAMTAVLLTADRNKQMQLICAHPDLAGKLAVEDNLTEESKSEQQGAGLDKCTAEEFEEFQALNQSYRNTFGFPFIIAVKSLDRHAILAAFRARINHNQDTEFNTALAQINRIAYMRLLDLAA